MDVLPLNRYYSFTVEPQSNIQAKTFLRFLFMHVKKVAYIKLMVCSFSSNTPVAGIQETFVFESNLITFTFAVGTSVTRLAKAWSFHRVPITRPTV